MRSVKFRANLAYEQTIQNEYRLKSYVFVEKHPDRMGSSGYMELPPFTYNLTKQENNYEFLTFKETEYTKGQKDLKRLEKMENALTESYTEYDKLGNKITIRVPQRLAHLVKEPE